MVVTDQRTHALDTGNGVRIAHAEIKRNLRHCDSRPSAWQQAAILLRSLDEDIARLPLYQFLRAIPGVGEERMRRICRGRQRGGVDVWPFRRLEDLTAHERRILAARIESSGGWGS